jgi:Fe-S oxidoreductase
MAEMFYVCTTCQQCNVICQVKTKVEDHWMMELRPAVVREGYKPPLVALRQASNIIHDNNTAGRPQEKRNGWMPADLRCADRGEIGYFNGCAASFNYGLRNLPINAIRILNSAGIEPVYLGTDEWCCGGTLFTSGYIDESLPKVEHNIKEFTRRGIKTIITSCAGCWLHLAHLYSPLARRLNIEYDIEVRHVTEVIDVLIKEGRIEFKMPIDLRVTYHDSCHIGRGGGIFEPPREILKAIPDLRLVEMPRNREHAACCGRHVMRYPRLGDIINSGRVQEILQTETDAVIGACPTCETNLRLGIDNAGDGLEVIDISDLVVWSMGLPVLAVSPLPGLICRRQRLGEEHANILQ